MLVHQGVLGDAEGTPLVVDGLHGLLFGPGAGGFGADVLFFTAGPDGGTHGRFGKLTVVNP
jgi:hypothetical protein